MADDGLHFGPVQRWRFDDGSDLGNAFGVTEINANETWVATAEWMQGPKGILKPGNQYGSDNSIYAARMLWKKPNREWDTR